MSRVFNLAQAKAGKPVCTRDGKKARIICFDRLFGAYPIGALVTEDGFEYFQSYTTDGLWLERSVSEDPLDLVMAEEVEDE